MSIYAKYVKPVAKAVAPAARSAATAFIEDKTGLNIERLSEGAKQSLTVPRGATSSNAAQSPVSPNVNILPGNRRPPWLVPALVALGVLAVVVAVKG